MCPNFLFSGYHRVDAFGSGARSIAHAKASAITGDADDDLAGFHSRLGDHDHCLMRLRFVDVGPKAVPGLATGNSRTVTDVCREIHS